MQSQTFSAGDRLQFTLRCRSWKNKIPLDCILIARSACNNNYARSDGVVGSASTVASGAPGCNFGGSLLVLALAARAGAGSASCCFFRLLPHNSVRLACCGGAFFPGGMVMNLARVRTGSSRLRWCLISMGAPRVCCLLMRRTDARLTRLGQVTMTVNM
jgi:hypothetical protein